MKKFFEIVKERYKYLWDPDEREISVELFIVSIIVGAVIYGMVDVFIDGALF